MWYCCGRIQVCSVTVRPYQSDLLVRAPVSEASTIEGVCAWALSVGLDEDDSGILRREKIDGASLFEVSDADLLSVKMALGARKKLLSALGLIRGPATARSAGPGDSSGGRARIAGPTTVGIDAASRAASAISPSSRLAALRHAVSSTTGDDAEDHVIDHIRNSSKLRDHLFLCETEAHFVRLYDLARASFGTATKRAIVAVDFHRKIVIDGDFGIPQESSSTFYNAYEDGIPCVLKSPPSPDMAIYEATVYDAARRFGGSDQLMPIEAVDFRLIESARSLPCHVAIKSAVYISTLQTCPQDSRLSKLWFNGIKSALSALSALHSAGYAHCDVKPGNIFVSSSGQCFLGDFDAATFINKGVIRTTDAFLPQELGVLKHSLEQQHTQREWLVATPAFDLAMLACTISYLMKPVASGSGPSSSSVCMQSLRELAVHLTIDVSDVQNSSIAAILQTCLGVLTSDPQMARGAEMLRSAHSMQTSLVLERASRDCDVVESATLFGDHAAPGCW